VVFSALVAIVDYELTTIMYSSAAPAIFIALTILTATIPFIVAAAISFTVAFITAKSSEPATERESESKTETKTTVEETPS